MGAKSAQELRQIVSAFALHQPKSTEPSKSGTSVEAQAERSASSLSELIYESTLREFLRHSDATVRLTNCIVNDPQLGAMTIREYLENTDISYARSLKTPNMGAKSAQELRQIVSAFALHQPKSTEPSKSGTSVEAQAEEFHRSTQRT